MALWEQKMSELKLYSLVFLCYTAAVAAKVCKCHHTHTSNQAGSHPTCSMPTSNHDRLHLHTVSLGRKLAGPMKPFFSWLTLCITSVGFGEVCSRSHCQVYLELIKLTRTLGLMQHAANSRVNCKTVRADEDGVSMRRNPIL